MRSGLGPFAFPRQVSEAIEPSMGRRRELLGELADLDRVAAELASSRLRAGVRGTAADVSPPSGTGRVALDECRATIAALEERVIAMRNAGMKAAR